jgi:hypothetical protein
MEATMNAPPAVTLPGNAPVGNGVPNEPPANGAPVGKEKKKRVAKPRDLTDYTLGERNAVGLLVSIPVDFNPKLHKPLGAKAFADSAVFYDFKAGIARKQAEKFEKLASQARQLGGVGAAEAKKAKKLLNFMEQFKALEAELAAKGIDIKTLAGTAS